MLCKGQLVIWTNKELSLDSTLTNLTSATIEKIAIANPQNAPYGIAAKELLNNLNLYDSIKTKLIFAENVAQLNQYIINKAADIGITAKSAVLAPKLHRVGKWKELPIKLYSPVEQYVVKLKTESPATEIAQKYMQYLSSYEATELLQKYGYYTN